MNIKIIKFLSCEMQKQDMKTIEDEIIVILRKAEKPLGLSEIMVELKKKDLRFPLIQNTVDVLLSLLCYRGIIESSLQFNRDFSQEQEYWCL